jgi:geranylgeranyl transferase type-1 subunit beta
MAIVYYCLSTLDILDALESQSTETDRETWRDWIWKQQICSKDGAGFRPGPAMALTALPESSTFCPDSDSDYDQPNLIMTYTALLSLAILRDDFSKLNRSGILQLLRSTQKDDGSFVPTSLSAERDLRPVYCAFAISTLLDDWSAMNAEKAVEFISRCRSYEGGYGQSPGEEAHGGTTYCALASLQLYARHKHGADTTRLPMLTPPQRRKTLRWAAHQQSIVAPGGFSGRTGKISDACYSFWCGASVDILGHSEVISPLNNASFISLCQFKFGGIAKAPSERPDPLHTYLSLASLSIYPLISGTGSQSSTRLSEEVELEVDSSWNIKPLNPLINARVETAEWALSRISGIPSTS